MLQTNLMKQSIITRFASFLLVIGFFYSCSSSGPTIESLVSEKNYEAALTEIELQLDQDPSNGDLYIQQGEIYLELANQEPVENRDGLYNDALNAFDNARNTELNSDQQQLILESINTAWSNELNTGTQLYENDTSGESTGTSIAHFDNAITLNDQDPTAYLSKSVALYNSNQLSQAIEVLNGARGTLDEVPDRLYEYLGFLHLQNSNADQAIFYYELANTDITGNKNIAFGLANIYILNREREKAIGLLEALKNEFPTDGRIKNVLGTQLFFINEGILNDLADAYLTNDLSMVDQLKFEAEGVGEQAEEELINAYEIESTNEDFIQSLAVFYNNLTGIYLSLTEIAPEEDAFIYTTKAETLVGLAIQYYEKLASLNPGDQEISSSIEMLKQLQTNRFSDSD